MEASGRPGAAGNWRALRAYGLLTAVILSGLALRVWGINFGLPYIYHPDEPGYVQIAQSIFKTGDLNPHFFNYPSVFFYINALAYIPYYLTGKAIGLFQSPDTIPGVKMLAMGNGQALMSTTFLLGRGVTAIFGSVSLVVLFLCGRQLSGSYTMGLLAALMMAVSPTSVLISHYITPDTFVAFFVLLSLWASIRVLQEGKTWHYAAAGIAIGLSASTKYNAAIIVFCLIAAHALRCGAKSLKEPRFYFALALSAAAFFLSTPFALLDHQKFLADLQLEAQHYSTGHAGMEGDSLHWYVSYLWQTEGPVTLAAIAAVVWGLYTRSRQVILLSVFPLVYFAFISSFVVRNDRTLLPLLPFLVLLASCLLVSLASYAKNQRAIIKRLSFLVVLAFALISLVLPFLRAVESDIHLASPDGRETSRVWINGNLPKGSRIAIESYSPYIDTHRFSVESFNRITDHSPDWYSSNGFDYLVFSEGMFGRFYRQPEIYASVVSQYDNLFRAFDMIRSFTDGGYEVRVYRVTR